MKKLTGTAIAAGLCVLMLFGCAERPVGQKQPEQEKIQIIGQIDATPEATETQSETPTDASETSDGAEAFATETPTPEPIATEAPTDTPIPTEIPTEVPTDTPVPTSTPVPNRTKAEQFCDVARSLLDRPYLRGGRTTEGFDPGGFTFYCLNAVGVDVRHKTSKGYSEMEEWQRIEAREDLVPGDLCFFITPGNETVNCVCIYLGNGEMIYPSSSQEKVIVTSIDSNYWIEAFVFARRVF